MIKQRTGQMSISLVDSVERLFVSGVDVTETR